MAVRKIAHPSIDERKAMGVAARDRAPLSSHAKWRPAADRAGPGRAAGGAGHHPRAGPGAGAARPDDGLAVHLLPGRRQDHGGGPGGHAGGRAGGPAVRGCAPVELRRVRLARAAAAVRPERLRRDAAGAVRVRREADGGELHDRRPQQRLLQGGRARGDAGVGAGLPGGDGRVRADGHDGHLVRLPGRGRADGLDPQRRGRDGQAGEGEEAGQAGGEGGEGGEAGGEGGEGGAEAGGEDGREGSHPRQPAGAVQARRAGRRQLPDRQPAAGRRAVPRLDRHLRPARRSGRQGDPRAVPRLPGHPAR